MLPTVPFVSAEDIDNAINLFNQNDADSVISTTKLDFPNEWILDVTDSKFNTKYKEQYKHSK